LHASTSVTLRLVHALLHARIVGNDARLPLGDLAPLFQPHNYTISDGQLVLTLEEAEEGGFIVTSPLDPELITQGETVAEAFANARDALQALDESRKLFINSCLLTPAS
jgi:antitoxin HicB